MQQERLQKIIAHAGVASRREAESMIRDGRVTVNGRVVTELGSKADADRDHIKVDGKLILRKEPHRYILLYKPKEVMTTVEDPQGRRTVIDLVRGIRERIYPVGRLDFHSEGLVLLTNDGELAYKVSHPTHGSVKTYNVKVRGVPEERLVDKLRRGITLDGKRTLPCAIERIRTTGKTDDEGNSWFEVRPREGRTQQSRKMFQALGHPVSKLRRAADLPRPHIGRGVMYRAVALAASRSGIDTRDAEALEDLASRSQIEFIPGERGRVVLNGEDVTSLIRTPEMSMGASDVSAVPG